ncbi:hypothetical protein VHUM_01121 [Vanrija humicola]|uniref:Amino acid transporter transmembrane domain-containing protein n=1 Tax=Vanrija humicola TaxID=5417 RepID=A0A7D8Z6Z5_VANHU|nr:hypothetical protein VHUM_01121 [Vanrija humicola]
MSISYDKHDAEKAGERGGASVDVTNAANTKGGYSDVVVHDAVFGDLESGGPNFRGVTAPGAFVLMTKANFGLGVLGIPSVFHTLGLVPGIIAICGIQFIYSWCASFIGQTKLIHPEIYSLADAAFIFGGRIGRELFCAIFIIFFIFCGSGAIIGVSTALNAVSSHGACTAVFIVVAAVVGLILSSIRTLSKVSWVGWAGLVSILSAILTVTVAVGRQERPAEAPQTGPWDKGFLIIGNPTFAEAMGAINVILFSSASSPIYYGIISEMRDPRKYPKAMYPCYAFLTAVYLIIGSVVYYFCGQYVANPALGSAGLLLKKICYGLALPGLCASMTIFNHVSAKLVFVRILGGTRHLTSNTWQHWTTWLGSTTSCIIVAYIIASAIPNFGSIISLVGALFCPISAMAPMMLSWIHDNVRANPNRLTGRQRIIFAVNIIFLCFCVFFTVAGTYAAVKDIIDGNNNGGPWSCDNNSGATE